MPKVKVQTDTQEYEWEVEAGKNLRQLLIENNLSPYGKLSKRLNCGGRGLCATCGVLPVEKLPIPQQWHDKWAQQFGYPRLSCQITVNADMHIRMVSNKNMWGKRIKKARP